MATTTIAARVDEVEAARIEALAKLENCDRSTLIKAIIREGVKALSLERAISAYRAGQVTLSKAAELADLSIWDFMALMPQNRLELNYDIQEFERDLEAIEPLNRSE